MLGSLLGTGAVAQAQQVLNFAPVKAITRAGTYTDLGTSGSAIFMSNSDDANSVAQNIGFPFYFNGTTFTTFVMNTNGLIRLGSSAPSAAGASSPYAQAPENGPVNSTNPADVNLIMPFNFDLTAGTSTPDYRVSVTGGAPFRVCTIQWKNVSDKAVYASATSATIVPTQYANFSFQAKLYENGRIEFAYNAPTVSSDNSLKYAVVGLKGSSNATEQNLLATKASAADWSTTTFTTGPQQAAGAANAHNFRSTFPPDAGRTYVFTNGPGNDDCANAATLIPGSSCAVTYGTTVGGLQIESANSCGSLNNALVNDVWYKFVASATSHTITATGSAGFDVVVEVRSGPCGNNSFTKACADVTGAGDTETTTVTGLTVGDTYYVRIYEYTGGSGTFTLCVTGGNALTCAAVTNAAVANTGSTTSAATGTLTFTPAAGATSYTVTLAPTGSTGAPATATLTGSPISLSNLAPSTSYTITITTNCANGGTSSTVTVVFTSAASGAPANDDCTSATTLTSGTSCAPITGTTTGATQSMAPITCGGYTGTSDDDVWYKFVATSTSHTVTVAGIGSFDAVVDVRSGTCANSTNIGCADATTNGGTETATLTGLTVGSTYYVRVYTYDAGVSGNFTICVTGIPVTCAAVTNAAVVVTGATATTSNATLTFTAVAGAASYSIGLGPTGGTATSTPLSGSPITLNGLTPNTSYTVTITTNCTNGGTSAPVTIVFTSGPAATLPANDDPTGAIALAVTNTCTPTAGTNLGSTTSPANGYTNPGSCGVATAPKDVWYYFTTAAGQSAATVTVTGAPAGLVRVFSATTNAGPFTQVNCAAGATNNTVAGPLSLTGLTPNTTYYVSVAGYGSGDTQGAFTICVTGPACAPATGLTASNVTTSGATLAFTPAAGVSSYTVTYTPAGGTAQTQTATGSPVTLTGLQAGKQYTVSIVTNCSAAQTSVATTTTFTTLTPCVAVTGLAAGSITTTGATLTFTPATAGTSYTVTYTAAGGTAQTQTATGSPVVLTGLTPSTQYTVSIVTSCGAGQTSAAATTTFTTLTPCTAVTSLSTSNVTTTSASLTFAGASSGTSYTVTYTAAGGTAQTQTATGSPVTLAGLTPGTQYAVSVVTNCGAGQTSPAASTTFTTLTPCVAVTSLVAGSLTTTSATLTFTAPAAGATGYVVTYTAAGGTAQTQAATGSPTILTGLTPGTQYTVSIVTSCGGGQTSAAATTTFTTLTPCTAVTGLTAGGLTATGATLTFTPTAGITSYAITYTPAGGTAQTQTATGSPVTLTGLQAGKQYTVSVVTNCGAGQTSAAATTTFTTPAPAPTNATASSLTATSASISFTPAAGATSYTVTYTATGGTAQTQTATGSPVALTGLASSTAYTVTIVANYAGGGTSTPVTVSFTTLQGLAVRTTLAGGELAVYPNPARQSFTVSLPALGNARTAQLELVNALGQAVSRQTISLAASGTQVAVDATGLATGIYMVQVRAGGETAITRLVIE